MTGIIELSELLRSMNPEIQSGEYIFCTVDGSFSDYQHVDPLAAFREPEGLSLIIPVEAAEKAHIAYETRFKQITLSVHSSLNAVGLTAAVSAKLAAYGMSANIVAAYHHDHIFVQSEQAERALSALMELVHSSRITE